MSSVEENKSSLLIIRPGNKFDGITAKRSIFLAGPTPRNQFGTDWRVEALALLEERSSSGLTVFVPSPFINFYPTHELNYYFQIEWETRALEAATRILFWVPREMEHMPGFTTNVEFGAWIKSGKVIYGRPSGAPKTGYLDWHAERNLVPIRETLKETIEASFEIF